MNTANRCLRGALARAAGEKLPALSKTVWMDGETKTGLMSGMYFKSEVLEPCRAFAIIHLIVTAISLKTSFDSSPEDFKNPPWVAQSRQACVGQSFTSSARLGKVRDSWPKAPLKKTGT